MLLPWLRWVADSCKLQPTEISKAAYRHWIKDYDTLDENDRVAIRAHIETLPSHILITIIMPVYDTSETRLEQAITSVRAQLYPYWELCLADDASPSPRIAPILKQAIEADCRVRWIRQRMDRHVTSATDYAVGLATGAWVALMDQDDILSEHALYEVAVEIAAHVDAQVIYSDEDRIGETGTRFAPYFKPDFDPDLLLGQNYLGHLSVYRRDLIERVGGPGQGPEGSHDLALRATAAVEAKQVRHIPTILYHQRLAAAPASSSGCTIVGCVEASHRAVQDHLGGPGAPARVIAAPLAPAFNRVIWPLPDPPPLVSIIVPTRDRAALLERCLDGVLRRTDYAPIEVLIIDNGSEAPETLRLFAKFCSDPRVRVLTMPGGFNYAALNNRSVAVARGEILLLLNNDVEVINDGWLREMVSQALRPDVGAVGAKLLYGNGKLQHAGTILGVGGVAHHYRTDAPRSDIGSFGLLTLCRSASAVTAACLAIRRSVFNEVGGLDEDHLAVAFNDVDLCLRVRDRGYRNIWTPFAELYHLESVSRGLDRAGDGRDRFQREQIYMVKRWGDVLQSDPYWNPNLSLENANGTLACPPRLERSWRRASQMVNSASRETARAS